MSLAPTREQLRQLDRENAKWPAHPEQVPRSEWPFMKPDAMPIEVWRSRKFLIQVFNEKDGALRMSVNRTTFDHALGRWEENITWEELQTLKRQIGRGNLDAIEIYPADSDVVNVANMRHLWILAERHPLSWRKAR